MHATFTRLRREAQLNYLKLTGQHLLSRRQLWNAAPNVLKLARTSRSK